MTKKILIAYLIFTVNSNDTFSQKYSIDAKLMFSPGITVGINEKEFLVLDSKGIVIPIEINISNNSPFKFQAMIPKSYEGIDMDMQVKVKTNLGDVYISDDKFIRYGGRSFFKNIRLLKESDLYAKYKAKMEDDCDFNNIEESFKKSLKYSSNPSQKLEVFRISSQRHYECGNRVVALKRLAEAYEKINFNKFDNSKKTGYWKDRINYFLKIFQYTNSSYPAREFGRKLEKSEVYLKIWSKLIEDFKRCYPETEINDIEFSAVGIKKQVEVIDTFMNPNTNADKDIIRTSNKKK
jgi:hypothetical protein